MEASLRAGASTKALSSNTPNLRDVAITALGECARWTPIRGEPSLDVLRGRATVSAEQAHDVLTGRSIAPEDAALFRVAAALRMTELELLTVALLMAVSEEPSVAQVVVQLQAPSASAYPTLGLLGVVFNDYSPEVHGALALACGNAVRCGLLVLGNVEAPLSHQHLSLPLALHAALSGLDARLPDVSISEGDGEDVAFGQENEALLLQHSVALQTLEALCVRSHSRSEGRAAARQIVRHLGLRAAFVEGSPMRGLGPVLVARELMPVFSFRLGPGERVQLPVVDGYSGPSVVLLGSEGVAEGSRGAIPELTIPVPSASERARLWRSLRLEPSVERELSERYRHGPGRIAHVGSLARHQAALEQSTAIDVSHVEKASWNIEGGNLGTLAQPVRRNVPDEALVAPELVRGELGQLLRRCRLRERLGEHLGPTYRSGCGVRALFVGPTGTGKTLAASWLATRLAMPLFRIDLASVTSKYIGETEKNLADVLGRAEHADVILLFDEADSLFGRRTEVRDSNDRFANAQTNYLLQRIESYDGIVLLTSNHRTGFDTAFSRRIDVIIEFPLPSPGERRELLRVHLGQNHSLTTEQLNRIAASVDLAGGHLANAVLTASVIAMSADRAITYADLVQGLGSEYRKLGRSLPAQLALPI